MIEIVFSVGRESSGHGYRHDRRSIDSSLAFENCICDPVLHVSKALLRILQILVGLWTVLKGVPDGSLLVWNSLEPRWPQIIEEKFEFVLVLLLILMKCKAKADSIMAIVIIHFLTSDIIIEGLF